MVESESPLYPLKFTPIYKQKVWGGRRLESLGRTLPGAAETPVGESWEVADLAASAPDGGGGGAERSLIANGSLRGVSLHEACARFGARLLGGLAPGTDGGFPLLVKYLDASENLSVQVHPSPAYAAAHDECHLKSEAWYIVDAEPDAVIYKGVADGVTADDLRSALAADDRDRFVGLLRAVPVKPGDCHYLPSGTCHALGAGVLVAEVQTPSDTTFRLYDWGRQGRALHVDAALDCIAFGPRAPDRAERRSHIAGVFTTVTCLVDCEHFRIEKVRMSEAYEQEIPYDQPTIWMVLQGEGRITPGPDADAVPFGRGETMLMPAAMPEARVHLDRDTVWLEVTFPQARRVQMA